MPAIVNRERVYIFCQREWKLVYSRFLLVFLQVRGLRHLLCTFIHHVRRPRVFIRVPGITNSRNFRLHLSRQRQFLVLLFVRLRTFFLARFARNYRRVVICSRLLVGQFRLLMLINRFLSISFSGLRNRFSGNTFNCRITIVVHMGDNIGQRRVVQRSATSTMGNAARFLNLCFR